MCFFLNNISFSKLLLYIIAYLSVGFNSGTRGRFSCPTSGHGDAGHGDGSGTRGRFSCPIMRQRGQDMGRFCVLHCNDLSQHTINMKNSNTGNSCVPLAMYVKNSRTGGGCPVPTMNVKNRKQNRPPSCPGKNRLPIGINP